MTDDRERKIASMEDGAMNQSGKPTGATGGPAFSSVRKIGSITMFTEARAEDSLARNIADKLRVERDEARADAVSWERQCDDARKLADLMGQERDEARATIVKVQHVLSLEREAKQLREDEFKEAISKLEEEVKVNASMLARQCALAREAETRAESAEARLRDLVREARCATEDMRASRQLALVSYADRIDAALRLAEGAAEEESDD